MFVAEKGKEDYLVGNINIPSELNPRKYILNKITHLTYIPY